MNLASKVPEGRGGRLILRMDVVKVHWRLPSELDLEQEVVQEILVNEEKPRVGKEIFTIKITQY